MIKICELHDMVRLGEEMAQGGSGGLAGGMKHSKSAALLTLPCQLWANDLWEVDDGEKTQEDLLGEEQQCSTLRLQPLGEESCVPLNNLVDEHPQDISTTDHRQLTNSCHSMDGAPLLRSSACGNISKTDQS